MNPNFEQLQQTVQNASQQQAPLINNDPALQKFNDINYQLPLSSAGLGALAAQTGTQVNNQKIAASNAKAKKENYQRVKKQDGGYAFFDGNGQEISATDYADAVGKSTADVLADSQNPIDIQYQNDYNNLQDFLTAISTGDQATVDEYYNQNKQLKNQSPQDVIKNFRAAYPTVFGGKVAGQPVGSTFIPSSQGVQANVVAGGGGGIGG